jgi:hypothetical protein
MIDPVPATALRLALALLLGSAALHKARDVGVFRETLRNYRLLPDALVGGAAIAVLAVETLTALALLWPPSAGPGALAALGLLATYTAAIGINLARGRRHIDCGCSGPAHRQPLSGWLLVRNGALLAGALAASLPTTLRPLLWLDAVSGAGCVLGLALLWLAAGQLMAEWPELGRLRRTA